MRHVYDSRTRQERPRDVTIPREEVAVVVAFAQAPADAKLQFDGEISCRSGRLNVGDAEHARVIDVPAGVVRVQVSLFPLEDADSVVLRILPAG